MSEIPESQSTVEGTPEDLLLTAFSIFKTNPKKDPKNDMLKVESPTLLPDSEIKVTTIYPTLKLHLERGNIRVKEDEDLEPFKFVINPVEEEGRKFLDITVNPYYLKAIPKSTFLDSSYFEKLTPQIMQEAYSLYHQGHLPKV